MIYIVFLIKHKIQQKIKKESTTTKIKKLCNCKNYPKNLNNTRVDVQVELWLKNGCLQLKTYTSEL